LDLLKGLAAAGEFGDDGFHGGGPNEGLGGFVPGLQELLDSLA
jgi:hypothetical protein